MSIQDRLAALEPREKRLIGVLVAVFAIMVLMSVPLGVSALLSDESEAHAQLTEAIERLETEGDSIRERQEAKEALLARYEKDAPALAGFLSKAATASNLSIPESKPATRSPRKTASSARLSSRPRTRASMAGSARCACASARRSAAIR